MSSIISYPSATPELADLLLGTKYDQDTNPTKNFSISGIRNVIADNTPIIVDSVMQAFTEEDTIASIGTASTVAIGAAQSNMHVSLDNEGVFTFNQDGTYSVEVMVNFGAEDYEKTANRYVLFAPYYNASQLGMADVCIINRSTRYETKQYNYLFNANEGDTLRFKISASAGETGGGVVSYDAAPFFTIPAISVYINKVYLE
jgi:hypothetical protein